MRVWDAIPRLSLQETQNGSNTLSVRVRRLNRGYTDRHLVHAPKFPKQQQESWFVVAFSPDRQRLLALERLSLFGRGAGEGSVELKIPENFVSDTVIVKVLSDGWRGIDVERTIAWQKTDSVV